MASYSQVPIPPDVPIPPSPDSPRAHGLGLDGIPPASSANLEPEPSLLSPFRDAFRPGGAGAAYRTPSTSSSTPSSGVAMTPRSPHSRGGTGTSQDDGEGPFNFQPMTLTKSPISKSGVGQRRGHKYKHSSVSHSIFQEPPPRPPISIPTTLPVPDLREFTHSRTPPQKSRLAWCVCHALVAAYTLSRASGGGTTSLARTALSHLLAFDALGAMLVTGVELMANFDSWRRPSIRHPFGLARAEVLAGFALSVLLLFMGLDLFSHNLQHGLEGAGAHEPHREHAHANADGAGPDGKGVAPPGFIGGVDATALLAVAATLVSALALRNHRRIGRALRLSFFRSLPSVLGNPAHCLTLGCAAPLLALPPLGVPVAGALDQLLASSAALAMVALGGLLVYRLGMMLLMSCPPPAPDVDAGGVDPRGVSGGAALGVEEGRRTPVLQQRLAQIVRALEAEPLVAAVHLLRVWQVHYGLCMAGVELRTRKGVRDEERTRLRERVVGLVRGRLAGGYGGADAGEKVKWEVSTQMTPES